jgi:hypothetical protein
MNFILNYLESTRKQFDYYKLLGEKSFDQLQDEDLLWQFNQDSNSIAVMVKHLAGNMLSRWTNFLSEDGEKSWRNRDGEFEGTIQNKKELLEAWNEGWTCLFEAMDSVSESNFDQVVYIRNQGHSITEALQRQLAHYAYHVGQIVYTARMIKGSEWQSLSIPKNASLAYNQEKFSQEKKRAHFTDEYLKKDEGK